MYHVHFTDENKIFLSVRLNNYIRLGLIGKNMLPVVPSKQQTVDKLFSVIRWPRSII